MDFAYNNLESTTHYAPTATPQYSTFSIQELNTQSSIAAKKVRLKETQIGFTDIISVQKSSGIDYPEFLVYGDKQHGLANDIATILAKIVTEQNGLLGSKLPPFIADIDSKYHFLETVESEIGFH